MLKLRGHHIWSVTGAYKETSIKKYVDPYNKKVYGEAYLKALYWIGKCFHPDRTIFKIVKGKDFICNICPVEHKCDSYTFEEMKEWVEEERTDTVYTVEDFDLDLRDQSVLDEFGLKVGDIVTLRQVLDIEKSIG